MADWEVVRETPLWDNTGPTEWAHQVYSEGDCWILAWYTAQLTDSALVLCGTKPWWDHVLIRLKPNHYLDVTGISTSQEIKERWA